MYKIPAASDDIEIKVSEFSYAIKKYQTFSLYTRIETLLAVMIVMLQALSMANL